MMESENTSEVSNLGERLHRARMQQGLSVHQLAALSGASAGMISQVERGISNPSINLISKIAAALGLSLGVFFEQNAEERSSTLVRKHERRRLSIPDPNFTYELLSPDLDHQLEVVWIESEPGSSTEEAPFSHEGSEFHLLLQGRLEVHVEDECYILEPGDSFTLYDCKLSHWYRNIGDERVLAVSVITPPTF